MNIDRLKELCLIPGISSREEKIREKIIQNLNPRKYYVDKIGNLVIRKGTGNKKILLMAHMDEIGFLITSIKENGNLILRKVGGIPDEIIQSRYIEIVTNEKIIQGVIGAVPPHLKKDNVSFELVGNVGLNTKEDVLNIGINIMDYAVFKKNFINIGNYISCRALDDRFGCFVLEEVYKNSSPKNEVIFAWTVQEEIGLKGAKALSNELSEIDLAIAIDSFACCSRQNQHIKPGDGPVIRFADNSGISSFYYSKKIVELAKKNNIPIQLGTTGGGTDGSIFVDKGTPFVALSVAVKFLHSTVEMIHINDLENLIKLLKIISEEEL
ncbi:M42 family metallopeptidase [Thermosipho atlanticus]|uniref:Putative aminopeptidase FrvX n=1 Tax=Thermosipho atlanticus DSM 15807 TaxID=1123380 RepID=A0A1M5R2N3_9BACT|nr:M42 family metallopeptidase [Thermosipho atlanticus]SHH20290.1 Putative aminopeptidase FrvX [Thermosipho atlanticus DSM 15807]